MPLTEKFMKKIQSTVTKNKAVVECLRCHLEPPSLHKPLECEADFDNCWKSGLGDVKTSGDGNGEENRRNAESLWTQAVETRKNQTSQKQNTKQASSSKATPKLPEYQIKTEDAPQKTGQVPQKDALGSEHEMKAAPTDDDLDIHTNDSKSEANVSSDNITRDHDGSGGFEKKESVPEPPSKIISAKKMDTTLLQAPEIPEGGYFRPARGFTEQVVHNKAQMIIASNHVKVTQVPDTLFVYSLTYSRTSFKTEKRLTFSKRREIELAYTAALKAGALHIGDRAVTNFKELWSTVPIHPEGMEENGSWVSAEFDFVRPEGITSRNVRIELCYKQMLSNINERLKSVSLLYVQDYIRALNAFVLESIKRRSAKDGIEVVQPSASKTFLKYGYTTLQKPSINGLRANRGYFASIRPGKEDILLNINTATSAFLPPSHLPDFLESVENISHGRSDEERHKRRIQSASKLLKGSMMTILYTRGPFKGREHIDYNSEERRTVKFTQFGRPASEQKFFALKPRNSSNDPKVADPETGKTVEGYFKEKTLSVTRGYLNEICVNVGKRVRTANFSGETDEQLMCKQSEEGAIWIPASFLQIKADQLVKTALPSNYNTAMIDKALRGPAANATMIEREGFDTIGIRSQSLKDMDFEVAQELVRVSARGINPPRISYQNQGYKDPRLASWNLTNVKLHGAGFGHIRVLAMPNCFVSKHGDADDWTKKAKDTIMKAFEDHGLTKFKHAETVPGPHDLSKILSKLKEPTNGKGDCTIILIPKNGITLEEYSYIKHNADRLGQHTLFAKGLNLIDGFPQHIASNLVLKMNLKYGGENHHLSGLDNFLLSGKRQRTLVMGADVWHPGIGSREGCPSVASVVGSVNGNLMSYRGAMRLQAERQERIEDLEGMTIELLKAWRHYNDNRLPENILFYRDGVSEAQFFECEKYEIPAIKAAFQTLKKLTDTNVKITFVVVVKRHHARFYALDKKGTYDTRKGENGNVKPGMLVEEVVTNRTPYNFFLQSHQALKGTARPAHYHVLQDSMKLEKRLPDLTHTLCYAFSRATKGVSYVAPAYMADRLCERGAAYLREWNDLDKRIDPSFNLSKDQLSTLTKQGLVKKKQEFAVHLNKTLVERNGGNWNERKSLWHSNLDQGMFWL